MIALPATLTHAGRTWTKGQAVRIPSQDFEGRIIGLYPRTINQPARAMVSREGDRNPRVAEISKLEALP